MASLPIVSFFVTSADSATFVLGMISEDDSFAPRWHTNFIRGLALSLFGVSLQAAGGLGTLQSLPITTALPFSVVTMLMPISLVKELRHEHLLMGLFARPMNYPDEGRPFRSCEDEQPSDPAESTMQQVSVMQKASEIA